MIRFLLRWGISTIALLVIVHLFSGVATANMTALVVMALVLGLLNSFLRPLLTFLSLPFLILTLGISTLFVNALTFFLAAKLVHGMYIAGYWSAFWAAILYSIITFLINMLLGADRNVYTVEHYSAVYRSRR